jgi:nucleotide-binding universal stress UspA family protein
MTKRILVPVDGSPLSERALGYAAALAGPLGATISLLRAVMTVKPHSSSDEQFNVDVLREAEAELEQLAARCTGQGLSSETAIWQDEAGWAIVEAARTKDAALIVMSTHGRSGLGQFLYGSVADRVMGSADAPIVLIPPGVGDDWARASPFQIVVPLDGSAFAEHAVGPAEEIARAMGAAVRLVAALDPPYSWAGADAYTVLDPGAELATAREYVESIATRMRGNGIAAHGIAVWGPPDRVILDSARDTGAHLIVMATHGRSGLARVALGSIAKAVLHRSTAPLMIVRPSAVRREAHPFPSAEQEPLPVLLSPGEVDVACRALAPFVEGLPTDEREAAVQLLDRLRNARELATPAR